MSRTYRAMARHPFTSYYGYQDRWYYEQVMPRERVRELYRRLLRGEIIDEPSVHRERHYEYYDLVKAAHHTVFRNRCSYRQRIHAIRLAKRGEIKTARAKLKQELARQFDQWPFVEGPEEDVEGESIALNEFM